MRERFKVRPEGFRLNYASPLATGLVFAGLGAFGSQKPTIFHDSTHFRNHGTLTNMDPKEDWLWVPALGRWALDFDGSDDYVIAGATTGLRGIARNGWTIACWAKWRSGTFETSISLGDSGAVPDGAILVNRNGTIQAYQSDVFRDSGVATPTTWVHLALTRVSSTLGTLYINGVAYSANPTTTSTDVMDLRMGRSAGGTTYADILATDGCAWNRVLAPSKISALADPSNAMLSVGGVPLLLPPRRRLWPVAAGPPSFKAAWAARRPRHIMATGVI